MLSFYGLLILRFFKVLPSPPPIGLKTWDMLEILVEYGFLICKWWMSFSQKIPDLMQICIES